ncbi:hypothetical protein Dsin_026883 [Dipteronia sinensis]|uniref:Uncharacterized protein n=1 Tax=Dipteronia sinensis TaxID=43782 RepID=A0AAE0DYG1_9ROSI|nr:hypothetical protein Dsin_026883 [Dipteronia sinensis]
MTDRQKGVINALEDHFPFAKRRSMIHPLPDQTMWPDVETHQIIPPPLHVQHGRPKLQRKWEPDERPKEGRTGSVVCVYPYVYFYDTYNIRLDVYIYMYFYDTYNNWLDVFILL